MIAPARPSSTVVLLRPARATIETFLVRRHDTIAFMGGAHVFPGGKVDDTDRAADTAAHCDGLDKAVARMPAVERSTAIAYHVAAVRELFEEAGVLLARDVNGGMVSVADEQLDLHRHRLIEGTTTLAAMAASERVRLALDELELFAHWVTPDGEPRRFDTRFFLAAAPAAQEAAHHAHEASDGTWLSPGDALERCARGEIVLPPPTWITLRALSRCTTIDAAFAWARASPVPRIQPRVVESGRTRLIVLPGDPMYPAVAGFDAVETRFVLEQGRWRSVAP